MAIWMLRSSHIPPLQPVCRSRVIRIRGHILYQVQDEGFVRLQLFWGQHDILPAAMLQFVLFHRPFTSAALRILTVENLIDQVNNTLFSWELCGRQEFFRWTTSISITA